MPRRVRKTGGSKSGRRGPKLDRMKQRSKHSYEHRGQTGKYGNIYSVDVEKWSCESGDHEIAVIPFNTKATENSPFRKVSDLNMPFSDDEIAEGETWDYKLTVLIHMNVGVNQDAVLCLRTIGQKCPLCEERNRLLNEEKLDYSDEEVRVLGVSKKCLYNILCFDNDKERDKGIQIWEAPHSSIEDVLSELANKRNRRTGEVEEKPYYQPEEGWNVVFVRVGSGLDTEYRQIEILERRNEDDFSDELDQLYEEAYNFEEIIEIKAYDEIVAMAGLGSVPKETEVEREYSRRGRNKEGGEQEPQESDDSNNGNDDDSLPDCFGVECNMKDECENCPDEIYEDCYKVFEEKKKAKANEGRRGSRGRR